MQSITEFLNSPAGAAFDAAARVALVQSALKEETARLKEKEETARLELKEKEETARLELKEKEETARRNKEAEEKTKRLDRNTQVVLAGFELDKKRLKLDDVVGSTTQTSEFNKLESRLENNVRPSFETLKTNFETRWKNHEAKLKEFQALLTSLASSANDKALQTSLAGFINLFVHPDSRRRVEDTCSNTYLSGLKPDLTLLELHAIAGALTAQAVFELKVKQPFSSAHRGQAWEYARILLESQVWRQEAKVALVSPIAIEILTVKRIQGQTVYKGAKVQLSSQVALSSKNAVYLLDDFVHQEFEQPLFPQEYTKCGSDDKSKASFELALDKVEVLSSTACGTVYKLEQDDTHLVVKLPLEPKCYQTELKVLKQLSGKALSVTTLLGWREGTDEPKIGPALFMKYHGVPITHRRGSGLKQSLISIVDTLRELHIGERIVHRDIRPANIVSKITVNKEADDGEYHGPTTTLIDFGLAAELGLCSAEFAGTLAYSGQRKLASVKSRSAIVYDAASDLESLAKTWILLSLRDDARGMVHAWSEDNDVDALISWWNSVFHSSELFRGGYSSAERGNYDELKTAISNSPFLT